MRIRRGILAAGVLALTSLTASPATASHQASFGDEHDRWGFIHCDAPDQVTVHALYSGDVHLAVHVPSNGVFIDHGEVVKWSHWTSKAFVNGASVEWHAADHGGPDGTARVWRANATCDAFAKAVG